MHKNTHTHTNIEKKDEKTTLLLYINIDIIFTFYTGVIFFRQWVGFIYLIVL